MRWRLKTRAIIYLVMLLGLFIIINWRLANSFQTVALNRAQLLGVAAVNRAILHTVMDEVRYDRLVTIRQDQQGQVVLVQPNPVEISRIVAITQLAVHDELIKLEENAVQIPLGQVVGSPLVATWGPLLTAKVVPVGIVQVDLQDSFVSAGINQTRHLVALDIKSTLKVVVPFYSQEVKVSTSMPLAETIVVGRTPNTYLQWGKGNKIIGDQP